jgi:hypothetical protein
MKSNEKHLRLETLRQLLEFSVQNPGAICRRSLTGTRGIL